MKLYRLIFVGKAFLLLVSIYLINRSTTTEIDGEKRLANSVTML